MVLFLSINQKFENCGYKHSVTYEFVRLGIFSLYWILGTYIGTYKSKVLYKRFVSVKICPCGSTKRYLDCCGSCIQLKQPATSPEALMRSRYSAFVEENWDYLKRTMRPPALLNFNKKESIRRAKIENCRWSGLEIIATSLNADNPNIGYVEFKAYYQANGKNGVIHENSVFHLIDGKWYYVDAL